MSDNEFLKWIYDRLLFKYKEPVNADYMIRLREISNKQPIAYIDKDDLEDMKFAQYYAHVELYTSPSKNRIPLHK